MGMAYSEPLRSRGYGMDAYGVPRSGYSSSYPTAYGASAYLPQPTTQRLDPYGRPLAAFGHGDGYLSDGAHHYPRSGYGQAYPGAYGAYAGYGTHGRPHSVSRFPDRSTDI